MEHRCTCGAVLPDDARFCHKCGKPQLEEDIHRLAAVQEPAPVQAPIDVPAAARSSGPAISFRNTRAVLISLAVAACCLVCVMASGFVAPALVPLVLCGGGFVAAKVYRGKSTEPLTAAGGARLGWMTGLWLFLVFAVMFAVTAIYVANPEGWEQLEAMRSRIPQLSGMQLTQHDFLVQMAVQLPIFFLVSTLLPGLGGILGARFPAPRRVS